MASGAGDGRRGGMRGFSNVVQRAAGSVARILSFRIGRGAQADLKFTGELRVEVDGLGGAGQETRGSTAGRAVKEAMQCPLCISTVLPAHYSSLCAVPLSTPLWSGPGLTIAVVAVERRCTGARRCFRACTACAQAAHPTPWLCQTAAPAAGSVLKEQNQTWQ